ncbi:MAG: hypothetical protein WCE30_27335 [Mycobacterium sp.]
MRDAMKVLVLVASCVFVLLLAGDVALYRVLRSRIPQRRTGTAHLKDG